MPNDQQNQQKISLQINIEDIKEILAERDIQILHLKSVVRTLSEQTSALTKENEMLKKDIDKLQNRSTGQPDQPAKEKS